MRNVQDTFETSNRSFINAFSICMTAPLSVDLDTFMRQKAISKILISRECLTVLKLWNLNESFRTIENVEIRISLQCVI